MADEEVDVVVIGSGAGGAPLTSVLINAGRQVLVLEKGPLLRTQYQAPDGVSDFKRDETFATGSEKRITVSGMANLGDTFYSSHVEPDLNDVPHVYGGEDGLDRATIEGYTAQVVGGGTQLYGGVSLRFTPDDFQLASFNDGRTDLRDDPAGDVRREARDWPINYETMNEAESKQPRTPISQLPPIQAPIQIAQAPGDSLSAIITAVAGMISAVAGLTVALTGVQALQRRPDTKASRSGY